MKNKLFQVPPVKQGPEVFGWVLAELGAKSVSEILTLNKPLLFFLKGPLGSGKTEFVKSAFAFLGADASAIQSPTFLKAIEHFVPGVGKVIHSDLYRVESVTELEKIGFIDTIENAKIVFIEWPELFLKELQSQKKEYGFIKKCPGFELVWNGVGSFEAKKIAP